MTTDIIQRTPGADRFTAPITFDFGPHVEPIAFDFGPHVEPIARAGYEVYFAGRPHRPWDDLTGDKTFRWKLAASMTADGTLSSPQAVRNVYLMMINTVPWSGLDKADRACWIAVLEAMTTAATAGQAAPAGEVAA